MQKNEGMADRIARAFFGVLALYLAYTVFSGLLQIAAYAIGGILIVTAVTGFCLLYQLFDINTKKR